MAIRKRSIVVCDDNMGHHWLTEGKEYKVAYTCFTSYGQQVLYLHGVPGGHSASLFRVIKEPPPWKPRPDPVPDTADE